MFEEVTLHVRPVARVVPEQVFDAFGWCASDTLVWRRPRGALPWCARTAVDPHAKIDGTNPSGMAFVFTRELDALPRELAALHVPRLAHEGEWALAPWGIDAATDTLYATRQTPREALLLAAESVEALVWGLHDWAHFHNHGPFSDVPLTELQCDHAALTWLGENAARAGLSSADLARARREVEGVTRERFAAEGRAPVSLPGSA